MSRVERRRPWSAELPDGRKIKGVTPDVILTRRALSLVPRQQQEDLDVARQAAEEQLIALCVNEIGGESYSYERLRGSLMGRVLSPREQSLVQEVFNKIRSPTDAEREWALDHTDTYEEQGDYRFETEVLLEPHLGEWLDLKEDREYAFAELDSLRSRASRDDAPAGIDSDIEAMESRADELDSKLADLEAEHTLVIEGVIPARNAAKTALEQVSSKIKQRKPALAQKQASENILRGAISKIDGVEVTYKDLRDQHIDEWLTTKEQNLINYVLVEHAMPEREEVDDFLGTVQIG